MKKAMKITVYPAQAEWIDDLVRTRLFGLNRDEVVNELLSRALSDLIETEFVRKGIETSQLLRDQ